MFFVCLGKSRCLREDLEPVWFLFFETVFENKENIILGSVWFLLLKTVFWSQKREE